MSLAVSVLDIPISPQLFYQFCWCDLIALLSCLFFKVSFHGSLVQRFKVILCQSGRWSPIGCSSRDRMLQTMGASQQMTRETEASHLPEVHVWSAAEWTQVSNLSSPDLKCWENWLHCSSVFQNIKGLPNFWVQWCKGHLQKAVILVLESLGNICCCCCGQFVKHFQRTAQSQSEFVGMDHSVPRLSFQNVE